MRSFLVLLAIACCLVVVGCAATGEGGGRPNEDAYKEQCKQVARKFGQAMAKGDWEGARALGTTGFQASNTAASMKSAFDQLQAEILKVEPTFKVTAVQVDNGSLPSSLEEAIKTYGIKNPPPMDTWRGWMFSIVGTGKDDDVERGIEARLFIVEEAGQFKVAHAEFDYPS